MNVMKQDAMDDKIIERCKTCEKWCMQEGLDRLRSCRTAIERKPRNLDGLRICQESIGQTECSKIWLNGSRNCRDAVVKKPRILDGSKICWDSIKAKERELDRKGICWGFVEILSSLKKKEFFKEKNIKSKLLKQRSK